MSLETFIAQYIGTALWAETDQSDDTGGRPLDNNYGIEDIAPEAMAEIRAECEAFYDANAADWDIAGMDDTDAAHDFYLTRNGHGAGFWDRKWNEPFGRYSRAQWREHHPERVAANAALDRLTDAAKAYGTQGFYVGDDNLIYTHS